MPELLSNRQTGQEVTYDALLRKSWDRTVFSLSAYNEKQQLVKVLPLPSEPHPLIGEPHPLY